jgi:flagellar hook-length control protein FliK
MDKLNLTEVIAPLRAAGGAPVPASDAPATLLPDDFRALLLLQLGGMKHGPAHGESKSATILPTEDPAHHAADTAIDAAATDAATASTPIPLFALLPPAPAVTNPATTVATSDPAQRQPHGVCAPAVAAIPAGQIQPDAADARHLDDDTPSAGQSPVPREPHGQPAVTALTTHDDTPRTIERVVAADAVHGAADNVPLAQAALLHALPAHAPAAATHAGIDTPINSPGWNTELAHKIVWMIGDKQQTAELRVNPPDLGPLDIKLTIDDHQTTAVFTSPHSAVRDAVESALPRLREVLAQSGITLGNASVTADSPRDQQPQGQPRQPAASRHHPYAARRSCAPTASSIYLHDARQRRKTA